ncbi:GAF domain-containing sensor histidine kinase [Salinimicrobium sp. CDJ15-81-2]|nr:GAF domain-containing sensor histidine kinase [Salinimicrobium nanhaiense]
MKSFREEDRIANLKKYEVLDTPADGTFDRFTRLAAELLEMPIAIISLVDSDRIWFKSKHGLDVQQIERTPGLCASAILSDDFYLVEDAKKDVRTLANPLVAGEFGLRFYAAVPLATREGYNLGTFCIIDKKPRRLSARKKKVLQDLADLVMFQMELRLEARTAIRDKHQLMHITAHDLKNPLSILPMMAEIIQKNKNNPEAIDKMAEQLKDAGKRMTKTITDLLDSALQDEENIHLRLKSLDLGKLVEGVVATNLHLAKNKKQKIDLQIEETRNIFGDFQRLTEVVDNLINNAIKYSPYGKSIVVTVKEKTNMAVISVEDQGPGLTEDDKKNLFREYTSLSAEPTGGEDSTGIGLSIVKKLVNAHKGKVYALSNGAGTGAKFVVELPLSQENPHV